MPGIAMSISATAKLLAQREPQRFFAGGRRDQAVVGPLEDGLEGQQVLRPVVDEQDVGDVSGAAALRQVARAPGS